MIIALIASHILNLNTEIDTQHSKGMLSGAGLNLIENVYSERSERRKATLASEL